MRFFHTPSFSHLLSLRLAVESSPYFFGTSIHLHPVIRTKSTAFTVDLSSALGLPSFAPGGSRGSILLHLTSSISSNFMKRRGCQTIISISRPRKLDKGVSIEIGSYNNRNMKKYEEHLYNENMEVTSMLGDITMMERKPF